MNRQIARRLLAFPLGLGLLGSLACVETKGTAPTNEGLAYFEVAFPDGTELGTADEPLPSLAEYSFTVDIRALDFDGERIDDWAGWVEIRTQSAQLTTVSRLEILDGEAQDVPVTFRYGANREVITVHQVEPWTAADGTETWRGTGKVGFSESIHLPETTIAMIQGTHDGNPNTGFISRFNNRNLTLTGRDFVAVAVIEGGLYIQDPSASEYGSLYLYTYSMPYVDDISENDTSTYHALVPGSVIESINGSIFEFFGFTEMSFPTYEPKRARNGAVIVDPTRIPPPTDITAFLDLTADEATEAEGNENLEKYESGLVTVRDLVVDEFDENDYSFVEHYQFPLKRPATGAHIMATTLSTAPTFAPVASKGVALERVTGVLKQHRSSRPSTWILVPRDIDDIVYAD